MVDTNDTTVENKDTSVQESTKVNELDSKVEDRLKENNVNEVSFGQF